MVAACSDLARSEASVLHLTQNSSNSSCLPSMPSQRVQSGLIGVMSGARDGNLDHQVRGEPETFAGSGGAPLRHSWSLSSSGQRVRLPLCLSLSTSTTSSAGCLH